MGWCSTISTAKKRALKIPLFLVSCLVNAIRAMESFGKLWNENKSWAKAIKCLIKSGTLFPLAYCANVCEQ